MEAFQAQAVEGTKKKLLEQARTVNGVKVITAVLHMLPENAKDLAFKIRAAEPQNSLCVIGSVHNDKPMLNVAISDDLVKENGLNAGQLVREAANSSRAVAADSPTLPTPAVRMPTVSRLPWTRWWSWQISNPEI